ncbi:MAG: very short patch repair endonuclease [Patescibacteria group bacterium]|nr:very short patch repair endonuclease [Patescibacteria group bacterium]
MADNLTREKRSKVMSSIRGKNTKPEIMIRKLLWKNGFRYRIHNRKIQGNPDISNKKKKTAIFIDGCFWHGCNRCYKEPTTNVKFWRDKIRRNKLRREKVRKNLLSGGWIVMEFWEHEINMDAVAIAKKIIHNY